MSKKSKRDKAKAKVQAERKDSDKPSDSKRGLRMRQPLEASHALHTPPVYGCKKCGPVIAAREKGRAILACQPLPWASPPKMTATAETPFGVRYNYHLGAIPREGDAGDYD